MPYLAAAIDPDNLERLIIGLSAVFVGWLLAVVTQSVSGTIRIWFRGPKLKVSFDNEEDCQTLTPEEYDTAERDRAGQPIRATRVVLFARLRVMNVKPRIGKQCQGWIVRIEEKTERGWCDTVFRDSMPLIWSYNAESPTADVPSGVTRHIDLLRIVNGQIGYKLQIRSHSGEILWPNRYAPLFRRHGTFRFTVLVSAEELKPARRTVTLTWDGNWPPKLA